MAASKRAAQGLGLRARLLLSLAAVILLAAGALAAAAAFSLRAAGREAGAAVQEAQMRAAQEALVLQNRELAGETAAGLQQAAHDLNQFAALLGAYLAQEGEEEAEALEFTLLSGGQQFAAPSESVEVFVPNRVSLESEALARLAQPAAVGALWTSLQTDSPAVLRAYYASPEELLFLYPNQGLAAALAPDFDPTGQGWYLAAEPENNPEGALRWIPAHPAFDGEQVLSLSLPVYRAPGDFAGAVGLDLALEQALAPLQAQALYPGSYSFLVDSQGRAFGLSAQGFEDFLGRAPQPGEAFAQVQAAEGAFTPLLARMLTAEVGFETVRAGERRLVIAFAPLEGTSWSVGTAVEAGSLLPADGGASFAPFAARQTLTRLLPAALGAALLALALSALVLNGLWKRLQALSDTAGQILDGDWSAPIPRSGNDEIGVLESLLESLRSQLHRAEWERVRPRSGAPEAQVQPERAARLLQAAAEAGDGAGLEALLDQIVQAAAREFDCRHAALYLLDGAGRGPRLSARFSPPAGGLSGPLPEPGPEGANLLQQALQSGEPRQAFYQDSGAGVSVLALLLRSKNRTLGALELHRAGDTPFSSEELDLLHTLAGLTALAVENAALSEALQARPGAYSGPARPALAAQPSRPAPAYQFDQRLVRPIAGLELDPQTTLRLQAGEMVVLKRSAGEGLQSSQLLAPIRLLDKTIGVIGFEAQDPEYNWGAEQLAMIESLAGQAALALENARLLEEAQQRAAEERLISEVTCSIRETLDIDAVLQTAAREIRGRLNLQEVTIRLGEDA